jgi:hypothetical protein
MASTSTEPFIGESLLNTVNNITVKLGIKTIVVPQIDNKLRKYFRGLFKVNNENIENIELERWGYHDSVFIKILDNANSSFTLTQLLTVLNDAFLYFDKIDISIHIKNRINTWVKNLGKYSYTWTELLDKPNYGLEIFISRFWPFFNVSDKDWKYISLNVLRDATYPTQADCINSDAKSTDIKKDYKIEYDISQKYNNFLGYSVMNTEDYPDMKNIILKLQILNNLNLKLLMFEAILKLLITPTVCHIIKEESLYELINPLFADKQFGKSYKNIFYHYMYYAIFILNHEDTVMFSQIKRNYRIIFTHSEALCMPLTYKLHVELDPYIQQITGETYLCSSVPYYLRCKRHLFPIDVFERRFFLATGGALANIPLHKFKAAVSGSILIPCLVYCELEKDFQNIRYETKRTITGQIKYNDNLYKFCDKLTPEEKDFVSYLEYYYPSFHSLTDNDYISQVLTQSTDVEKKISDEKDKKGEKKEEPDYKLKYNLLSDIDISITTDNYETFDNLAQLLTKQIQLNCIHIGEVWVKKIYTVSSFKYKIYGPGLMRPIDLFRVPYGPDKMVKKFHCPIVRSWYDGKNKTKNDIHNHEKILDTFLQKKRTPTAVETYDISYGDEPNEPNEEDIPETVSPYYIGVNIIRSCIATALTGINNEYKWFFNSKPCVEVILKYAQRGFTTIINQKEITALVEYMKISPRWKQFVSDDIDTIGMMTRNHVFFNPCTVNAGIRHKLRNFRKSHMKMYNMKQPVGLPQTNTEYDVNLAVKNNTKVFKPDVNKINMFVNYIEQLQNDFSDGDDF